MAKTTIEELEKRIVKLERQVSRLEKNGEQDQTPVQEPIVRHDNWTSSCRKCGMTFTDAYGRPLTMGFVCFKADCPVFVKPSS